ncbi:hypothetical protein Bcop_1910 [Bacteroides coprosuis DSM 18011]|uniref:Major fimbrium tip subunit FimD third Ig-like domain-containing protein n=1 Tax=Bacteroides coprosuis DSM 18011 TaxID=679937 RepID=F3ZS71_9BACE|nr:FimB/Mfa2 family fimbrial subunit [Bacteroides coprosuis]EGJ72092.1 hypothetical protein Bcop_1910 [Bacteroides coprosuis DSM 18011]
MNKIKLYLVVLLAIAFSSCIGEELVEEKGSSNKELILTLAYSNQIANGVTASSRATEVKDGEDLLNENRIEKVDIFFYTEAGELTWHVEPTAMRIEDGEDHTKKLTLRATKEIASELNNKKYKLVVLVNGPDRGEITDKPYNELQQKVYTKNLDATERQRPLDLFLMDGEKETGTIKLDEEPYNLGNVELSRAAAKIRVLINKIEVDGYKAGTPTLKLVTYAGKTALLGGKPLKAPTYKTTTEQNLIKGNKIPYTTNYPLYSFENDWKEDDSKMTYLLLKIPFSDTTEKKEADYYYRVPIYYSIDSNNSFSIKRNHLYEVNIDIERLGASTEELPVELSGKIDVEPWKEIDAVHAQLHKANYLVVKETELDMMNVAEKKIEYISNSTLKVKDSTLKAHYFEYDTNGNSQKVELKGESLPKISFTESDGKTFIQINKEVPNNYAPLYIEFTVQNEGGLEEKVNIVQYPPRYITGINPSDKRYYKGTEGNPKSNTTLFTVTTVVPVEGDIIGDPTDVVSGKTGTDELSNKIISPQFIIASQLGVTYQRYLDKDEYNNKGRLLGESGETRCSKYWERNYGDNSEVVLDGVQYLGKWRLPTKAEIEYIQRIQRDPNSSVKSLLEGEKYWSAYHHAYFNFKTGKWPNAYEYSKAHIRCVFDIYKSEPTKQ